MGNLKFAARLSILRTNAGMTQKEFAEELTRRVERTKEISPLTISAYENSTKTPPLNVLVGISDIFGVSTDYLLGIGEAKEIKEISNGDSPLPTYDILIRPQEYKEYDGQPVFVVFKNMEYRNQWGIYDHEKRRVVMSRVIFPISNIISLYRFVPLSSIYTQVTNLQPLTMHRLNAIDSNGNPEFKIVWVEMQTQDPFIQGRYNGWYRNDVENRLLINQANDFMLRYEACGISYNAYNMEKYHK